MLKENEELLKNHLLFLREKYTKERTVTTFFAGINELAKTTEKNLLNITKEELVDWKKNIENQNKKRTYVYGVNLFYEKNNKPNLKLTLPRVKTAIRKTFTSEERDKFIKASKKNPLDQLIAVLLYDSIPRPIAVTQIRISLIDWNNHKIWLDTRKANHEMALLMGPRVERAIREYLAVRPKPINKEDDDILLINPRRRKRFLTNDVCRRRCRKIALRAGIEKDVTPYKVVKPSAITNRFDEYVNPKIIQRLAGHKNIETTLKYCHTEDRDALKYLENQEIDYSLLPKEEKAKILMDKFLKNEIDKTTFDTLLDALKPEKKVEGGSIGYS